jgi:hypothetical protein
MYHFRHSQQAALQIRSDLNIPRNEAARPPSQFPQSCTCERFVEYIPSIGDIPNRIEIVQSCRLPNSVSRGVDKINQFFSNL